MKIGILYQIHDSSVDFSGFTKDFKGSIHENMYLYEVIWFKSEFRCSQ